MHDEIHQFLLTYVPSMRLVTAVGIQLEPPSVPKAINLSFVLTRPDLRLEVLDTGEGSGQRRQRQYGRRPPCLPVYPRYLPALDPVKHECWNRASTC